MKENRLVYQKRSSEHASISVSDVFEYKVKNGDTLVGILKKQYGKYPTDKFLQYVAKKNSIDKKFTLKIGQNILLPSNKNLVNFNKNIAANLSAGIGVDLIKKKNVTLYPGVLLNDFDKAKESLENALKFIKNNVTDKKGNALNIDFDNIGSYLAVMHKESRLKSTAGSKKNDKPFGYWQLKKVAVLDVIRDFNAVSNETIKWNNSEYLTNPLANCVYGVLYLELLYSNINNEKINPEYKNLNNKEKKRLSEYTYNKGATTVKKLWNYFKPSNFDDFENKLTEKLSHKLHDINIAITDSAYSMVYFLEFPMDKRIQNWRNSKLGTNNFIDGVSNDMVAEMLEYPRMIEAIRSKSFPSRMDMLKNKGIHVVVSNESLYMIAKLYPGVSAENIMEKNKMTSDYIQPGQQLIIPTDHLRVSLDQLNIEL